MMKNILRNIYYTILAITKYPIHYALFYLHNERYSEDYKIWLKIHTTQGLNNELKLAWLFESYPEFRNLFYYRSSGIMARFLNVFAKQMNTLYIQNAKIGGGLIIWHGFSTIINAESIGENCSIWQQVTIGNKFETNGRRPRIGNGVKICAGAIVIGDVTIGDNSVIGAGAVVTRNVPSNVIVAGVPARVIKEI